MSSEFKFLKTRITACHTPHCVPSTYARHKDNARHKAGICERNKGRHNQKNAPTSQDSSRINCEGPTQPGA